MIPDHPQKSLSRHVCSPCDNKRGDEDSLAAAPPTRVCPEEFSVGSSPQSSGKGQTCTKTHHHHHHHHQWACYEIYSLWRWTIINYIFFFLRNMSSKIRFFLSWDCKWFEMKLRWSFHWEKATASQEIWFVDVAPIFEGSKSNGTNEQIRNQTLTCEYLVGNVCRTHLHRFPFAHGQLSIAFFFFFFRCLANSDLAFLLWKLMANFLSTEVLVFLFFSPHQRMRFVSMAQYFCTWPLLVILRNISNAAPATRGAYDVNEIRQLITELHAA